MKIKLYKYLIVLPMLLVVFLSSCAAYNKKVYVIFETNGGSTIAPIYTDVTKGIELPNVPSKVGFIFDGWYLDDKTWANSFDPSNLLNYNVDFELIIYAKWNAIAEESLFTYDTISDEVYITGYLNKNVESLTIPTTLYSKVVKEFKGTAFQNLKYLKEVNINAEITFIPKEAFIGCSELVYVGLSNSITEIRQSAFSGDANLLSINLSDSLVSIGDRAFQSCKALGAISFPSTLQTVGAFSFYNCLSLASVGLIGSTREIKESAFEYCSNLRYINLNDGISKIGSRAFANLPLLEEITLPNALEIIEESLFESSYNLQIVHLEEGLTTIEENAFKGCVKLNTISLPSSLLYIKDNAFYGCTALEVLDIPTNLEEIGFGSLEGTNLTSLTLPFIGEKKSSPRYLNLGFIFGSNDVTLNDSKVPSSLKEIGITKQELIYQGAFENFKSLESVVISDTANYFESEVFKDCDNIKNLTLPFVGNSDITPMRTNLGYLFDRSDYYNDCFGKNYFIDEITITNTKVLGSYALSNLASVYTLNLPDELEALEQYSLSGMANIENFEFPSAIRTIGFGSIQGVKLPAELEIPFIGISLDQPIYLGYIFGSDSASNQVSFVPNSITKITILAGNEIPALAFYGLGDLQQVVFPESITTIRENIFEECFSLTSLTLPFLGSYLNDNDGSRLKLRYTFGDYKPSNFTSIEILHGNTIGNEAFKHYNDLSNIIIPDEVKVIGNSAFESLSNFESFDFPSGLEEIGRLAFANTGITSITIPDTVDSIGDGAFEQCASLSSIHLPSSLEHLPESIFNLCTTLAFISLPDTIETIGAHAFEGCIKLTDIELSFYLRTIGDRAFRACTSLARLYVPNEVTTIGVEIVDGCANLVDLSIPFLGRDISDENTATLSRIISTSSAGKLRRVSVEYAGHIYSNAFKDFTKIERINIPSTVTHIESNAFYNTADLRTFTLPTYLIEIGEYAFYGSHVSFESLPSHVRNIRQYAFYGCAEIPNFTFSQELEIIGDYAFKGCTGMWEIEIPENIKSIGIGAFEDCLNITDVIINGDPEEIGDSLFKGCIYLRNLALPYLGESSSSKSKSVIRHTFGDGTPEVDVPDTLLNVVIKGDTSIADQAFYEIPSLVSVTFDGNLIEGDDSEQVFMKCTSLKYVKLPSTSNSYNVGGQSFRECTSLESITLPTNLDEIRNGAFAYCSSLTEVNIPDTIKTLGGLSFAYCTSLSEINFPEGLQNVNAEVFKNCTSLTSVVIPSTVTYFQVEFLSGSSITTLSIPFVGKQSGTTKGVFAEFYSLLYDKPSFNNSSEVIVTNLTITGAAIIGQNAIKNMTGLKELTITNPNVTMASGFLDGCTGLETLTVTHLGLNKNDADTSTLTSWGLTTSSNLKNINITGETFISNEAFKNFTKLETINISGTLLEDRKIGNFAFQGLTNFDFANNLTLPSNLEILGEGCFASNTFTSITLPEGILEFEDRVFGNCTNLHHFVFPDSVLRIGDSIFQGCTALLYIIYSDFNSGDSGINQIATLTSLKWVIYKSPVIRSGFFYQNNTSDRVSVYIDREFPDLTNNDLTNTNLLLGGFDFRDRWSYGQDGIPAGAPK